MHGAVESESLIKELSLFVSFSGSVCEWMSTPGMFSVWVSMFRFNGVVCSVVEVDKACFDSNCVSSFTIFI